MSGAGAEPGEFGTEAEEYHDVFAEYDQRDDEDGDEHLGGQAEHPATRDRGDAAQADEDRVADDGESGFPIRAKELLMGVGLGGHAGRRGGVRRSWT